ncbi:MAG: single-stranded DNA-binding protein [Thioalkalivibrio sp.]|nr:single-stranded DNA-binding protein [Thioalkalivibrio sp.]
MSNFRIRGMVGVAPQVRTGQYGDFVSFTVADNLSRRLENGSWDQVDTTWYTVNVRDNLADLVMATISKGDLVEVEAGFVRAGVYVPRDGSAPRPSLRVTARGVVKPLSRQMVASAPAGEVVDGATPEDFDGEPAEQTSDEAPF